MLYIQFEREAPTSSNVIGRLPSTDVQQRQLGKMATVQQKIFCVREFIKTESATAVQRAFRLRFNIQTQTRKSICRWNSQFEQIGCLCKGKLPDNHVYRRRR